MSSKQMELDKELFGSESDQAPRDEGNPAHQAEADGQSASIGSAVHTVAVAGANVTGLPSSGSAVATSVSPKLQKYQALAREVLNLDIIRDVVECPQRFSTILLTDIAGILKEAAHGDPQLIASGEALFTEYLSGTLLASAAQALYGAAVPADLTFYDLVQHGASKDASDGPLVTKVLDAAKGKVINLSGATEVAYVVSLERFVLMGPGGRYDVDRPIGQDAALRYMVNQCVPSIVAKKVISEANHPTFLTIGFEPDRPHVYEDGEGRSVLNIYVPSDVTPVRGAWPSIFFLLCVLTQVCSNGVEGLVWLFNWMAAKAQHLKRRGMTVPVFVGPQGCGKSLAGILFARVLGLENTAQISGKTLKDSFNSQFAGKCFIVADEVIQPTGDRLEVLETMKTYITDERVDLAAPHQKRVQIANCMSFWMTSNSKNPVRVEGEADRRYTVFSIPDDVMTEEYKLFLKGLFDPRTQQPTAEVVAELEALAHDLQHWDVDWTMATTPLDTVARRDLIQVNRSSFDLFGDLLEDEPIIGLSTLIEGFMAGLNELAREQMDPYFYVNEGTTAEAVYGAYTHFCKKSGLTPLGAPRFGVEWKQRFEVKWPRVRRPRAPRVYLYEGLEVIIGKLPSLEVQLPREILMAASDEMLQQELERRQELRRLETGCDESGSIFGES